MATDKLDASRSHRRVESLALEMADDAIALYRRDALGLWQEVGVAYPDSDDFNRQIAWLKAQANPSAKVVVWVPAELVEHHDLELKARRQIDKRFLAAQQIAKKDETGLDEVEIALGKSETPNATSCLSMATQTRKEAEAYARKWGFDPICVTVRSPGPGFAEIPHFEACETQKSRSTRRLLGSLALVGSIVTTTGLSAAVVWAVMLAGRPTALVPPDLPDLHLTQIDQLDQQPQVTTSRVHSDLSPLVIAAAFNAPDADRSEYVRPAEETDWIARQVSWEAPSSSRPSMQDDRLALGVPLSGGTVTVTLASLTEPIETAELAADLPVEVSGASLPEEDAPGTQIASLGNVPIPVPRPKRASADEEGLAEETQQPDVAVTEATQDLEEQPLGIVQSPNPVPRPDGAQARFAAAKTLVPRTARATGTRKLSVTRAAKREGLPLDRTSLIGIINMQSGREALLRLANGRIQRVARGEIIQGWSVRLIGQDAVRLERGDESHTLILVTR